MAGTPAAAFQHSPRGLPSNPDDPEDENETGGLDDDDIAISRDVIVRGSTGRSFQVRPIFLYAAYLHLTLRAPDSQGHLCPARAAAKAEDEADPEGGHGPRQVALRQVAR